MIKLYTVSEVYRQLHVDAQQGIITPAFKYAGQHTLEELLRKNLDEDAVQVWLDYTFKDLKNDV